MRLFVSVPLPVEQREHLQRALVGGRTTDPERWHLTLAFLGDRDDDVALLDALAAVASQHPPFELRISGAGSFPGVEWAGVDGDLAALEALARDVARACRVQQGVYRPHVTVARRGRAALSPSYAGPPWTVDALHLVESRLERPVVHTSIAQFFLRTSPADEGNVGLRGE